MSKLTKQQISEASAFAETFQICGRDWDTWQDEQLAKLLAAVRSLESAKNKLSLSETEEELRARFETFYSTHKINVNDTQETYFQAFKAGAQR